jgi:hypothetical protein
MYLKINGVYDEDIWKLRFPPKGGDTQWEPGRSALELARYMTAHLPRVPYEIERALSTLTDQETMFDWKGEHVTKLPGAGEGRNHDAIMWNGDVFVGIEGKADEPFGSGYVSTEYKNRSDNKKLRVEQLSNMIWGDTPNDHYDIRYQLLTATAGTLLEAKERGLSKALLLVVVFKHPQKNNPKKQAVNSADIQAFLDSTQAVLEDNLYRVFTVYGKENGIDLFFKKIEIDL